MIEILLARLHQLTNKLRRIANHTTQNTYGDGLLGNWYIGTASENDDVTPNPKFDKYITYDPNVKSYYQMPFHTIYNFENLTIDENAVLKLPGDSAVIRVRDTFTLYGTLNLSACHNGGQYYTNGGRTWQEVHAMGSVTLLPERGFIATGASGQGGICVIYYNRIVNYKDQEISGLDFNTTNVLLNGGTGLGGGYLVIIAKKVVLADNSRVDVRGGDGTNPGATGILYTYKLREADL